LPCYKAAGERARAVATKWLLDFLSEQNGLHRDGMCQGCQIGFFKARFQKSGFLKIWLASQNSFGFLAFSWRFYMPKLSARK
jgi:hypothetical protein